MQQARQIEIEFPEKLQCLFQPSRYKVLYGGRGGAKSWNIARALILRAVQEKTLVLCAREVQRSLADSVHRLLSEQIQLMGLGALFQVTDEAIRGPHGSEFFFAGLRGNTVENLRSFEGVKVCWVEEAQLVRRRSWDALIPTIRRDDSEIWISFNPELATDETYDRFVLKAPKNAAVVHLTWRDNPWFPAVLEAERVACLERDPVGYRNIWEGECRAAVEGAIYAQEVEQLVKDGRFRPVPYDPMLLVHTVWDLGWNDKMAIGLVQRLASELRVIEYIEDSHRTLADYVRDLESREYRYGTDWLPHDGAAKDFKTGKSAQEILVALGRRVQIVPKIDVEQGIKSVRILFPRLYIDDAKADRLLECLRRYRRMIPATTHEPSGPLHDEFSHGSDMTRYMAACADQMDSSGARFKAKINYPKLPYA